MAFARTLPQKDPIYDEFRAKISLLQILQSRGYDISQDAHLLDGSKSLRVRYLEYKTESLSPPEPASRSKAKKITLQRGTDYIHPDGIDSPLEVMFVPSTQVSSIMTAILDGVKVSKPVSSDALHLMFVTDKPREITPLEAKLVGINTVEILSYQRLLINPMEHYRSPTRIEVLTRDEQRDMLTSEGIRGKILPGIMASDPLVLFLDLKPEQVYRSIDTKVYTGQNIPSVSYRITPRTQVCSTEGCKQSTTGYRLHYCAKCL